MISLWGELAFSDVVGVQADRVTPICGLFPEC